MQNIEVQNAESLGGPSTSDATQSTPEQLVNELREVKAFADLPEDQLRWFVANSHEWRLAPGEVMFRKGDPAEWMVVYLEGEMQARRDEQPDGYIYIASAGDPASEVSGKLPFSRMTEFSATGRAVVPTRLLRFHVDLFPELMQRMPVLVERLVGVMTDRTREVTKADQQRDKLMSLGKLSAGLAHELNNPAAAGRRAAKDLRETLNKQRSVDLRLCRHGLSPEQRQFISTLEHELVERTRTDSSAHVALGSLERSDLEDELNTWLDDHNVSDGWEFAPTFSEVGVDVETMNQVASQIDDAALGDVLSRISATLSTSRLVNDIEQSTSRISELVGAIKEYSYMDQAPVQEVDVHRSLESTLVILGHELKVKSIMVERDYASDLPRITAYGSELNQLWTNLIDNAIDAMTDGGRLRLRTVNDQGMDQICVEIRDNGAGIPPDVKERIFEPFFTTKGVGEGTGLGLDTVYRIVRKHHGTIRVDSEPGNTRFCVYLPVKQA